MKMEMQSGNLLLVFIYSLSLLLIGCAVGMHWRDVGDEFWSFEEQLTLTTSILLITKDLCDTDFALEYGRSLF